MMVLLILLCPLAAMYVFGLLISTGISLWRLIKHDYGRNSTEEPNLKPALDTLYCLALLQGVLFSYRFLLARTQKRLAKEVIANCDDEEEEEEDLAIVSSYLGKTRIECEKDPSSARGRNLITCGVDLIGSKSPDDCLSGVQMLHTTIRIGERGLKDARTAQGLGRKEAIERFKVKPKKVGAQWEEIVAQHTLMKHLIVYAAPSSPVLQKLFEMLYPRAAYDRKMRDQATRIVAHLALDIHLEQFPRAIQYISTLIGMTFEEYNLIQPYNQCRLVHKYDQKWIRHDRHASRLESPCEELREDYEKLVLRGLCILRKLATREDNCRIMSQTRGLLPRIMAPLTSDIIHQFNGGASSISLVVGSLEVMRLLVASPGETGVTVRRDIWSNKEAIVTMERILGCHSCCAKLKKRAMGILTQLYMDNQLENISAAFIEMLVHIFAGDSKEDMSIRRMAGEALAKLSIQDGSNTSSIILQVSGDVLGSLTKILLLDEAENKTCRIRAAEILEQMCIHHTQDDECTPGKLKKAMTDTMPKVLAQLLSRGPTKDETHARTKEDQVEVIEKEVDIENPCDENGRDKTSSITRPQNSEDYEDDMQVEMEVDEDESENDEDEDFQAPLLSLCVTIWDTLINADQDLAGQLNAISFPGKLKDMVAENSAPTVLCLRLMKLTCKMVISMMKHSGSYLKEDLESLTEALSRASESTSLLDISMFFASEDDVAAMAMKPVRSLGSFVTEAKESVATYFKAQESENMQPVTSADG